MKKILSFACALALASALCACSSAPKASSGPSPSPTGAGAASASPAAGSEASATPVYTIEQIEGWPGEIPAYVPKFEFGAFVEDASSKMNVGSAVTYGMAFTGVARQDVEAYLEALKQAGYEAYPGEAGGLYAVAGTYTKSGEMSVMASASLEEASGKCAVTVILTPVAK